MIVPKLVMKIQNTSVQNSKYPRCIDGRIAIAAIQWNGKHWIVAKRNKEAAKENGPEFLGGSLMFIKALEILGNIEREKAFDFTERASRRAGLGLQIHIDDNHGKYNFFNLSDKKIITTLDNHHTGCSYSRYAWGKEASEIINKAKLRKWRIQVLTGDHRENRATIDYRPGISLDNLVANKFNEAQFNLDQTDAEKIFMELEKITGIKGFASDALQWMIAEYKKVVVSLKGVKKPSDIIEVK